MRNLPIPKAFGTHTFASRTSPSTDQSLQKSVLFGNPKRNSNFFSHPSVFYFFTTYNRHVNSWTEATKTFTDSNLTLTVDRTPAYNSTYKKLAVQWLNDPNSYRDCASPPE